MIRLRCTGFAGGRCWVTVTIGRRGRVCRGAILAVSIRPIPWENVQRVTRERFHGHESVTVRLPHAYVYVGRLIPSEG